MKYLLDTSVLIALCDTEHSHYAACNAWFASNAGEGWTTCSIAENGMIRITSQDAYRSGPASLRDSRDALCELRGLPTCTPLPDDVSVCDSEYIRFDLVKRPEDITDAYLLGICRKHGLKLVTTDRKLEPALAPGEGIVETL